MTICSCKTQSDDQFFVNLEELTGVPPENQKTGLKLVTDERAIDLANDDFFTFTVENFSEESIEFLNIHFGLMVFQYNNENEEWEKITLNVKLREKTILLSPGNRWSNIPMNSIWLDPDDFNLPLAENDLRFFISVKAI